MHRILVDAPNEPTPEQAQGPATTSCDVAKSKVCARAHVDGHRLSGTANIKVAAGYKSNVVGFGWTNGVYVKMHDLLLATPEAAIH